MEVHAHTHTERKKLMHYLWEFLMLFLAVTLGFLVENQREHYIEMKRAKEYAISLLIDLKEDSTNINHIIKLRTLREQSLSTLMDELEKKPANQNDSILFQIGANDLAARSYVSFQTGTYEQIKNSGALRYFNNETAAAMVKYESTQATLEKQLEIENKYVLENIIPLRAKFCNPIYLRYEREEKPFTATDPLITKDPDIQLQVYRSVIFLQERNRIYTKRLNNAAEDVITITQELKNKYHLE
jgi:hypothetical protein